MELYGALTRILVGIQHEQLLGLRAADGPRFIPQSMLDTQSYCQNANPSC